MLKVFKSFINILPWAIMCGFLSLFAYGYITYDDVDFAKRDVKEHCLNKGLQECQVCVKRLSSRCDLYVTLKGKEIAEFVNS